jgi:hypothetical protein
MTNDWLVEKPLWGQMDEVHLTMRVVDLVDELFFHVIEKDSKLRGNFGKKPFL